MLWHEYKSSAARVVQADRALRTAIITFNGNYEGLQQTTRLGNVLVLVNRPQEAVFALQLLKLAFDEYFTTVADYNRAQFELLSRPGLPGPRARTDPAAWRDSAGGYGPAGLPAPGRQRAAPGHPVIASRPRTKMTWLRRSLCSRRFLDSMHQSPDQEDLFLLSSDWKRSNCSAPGRQRALSAHVEAGSRALDAPPADTSSCPGAAGGTASPARPGSKRRTRRRRNPPPASSCTASRTRIGTTKV